MKLLFRVFSFALAIMFLTSCTSSKNLLKKKANLTLSQIPFKNHFSGIFIYDPESRDTVYTKNSEAYFTPASNTKIATLFASIKLLPKRIPVLKYHLQKDTLHFTGTGDPTQLHPYFMDSTAVKFLSNFEHIVYYPGLFKDRRFAPGWAWEDYQWYFSPERSAFPLYGNVVTLHGPSPVSVIPEVFKDSIKEATGQGVREEFQNLFYFPGRRTDTLEIPYITSARLTKLLLEQALQKKVTLKYRNAPAAFANLEGISRDSVAKRMMHVSDNFLAEQLLIMASTSLSDTLSSAKTRAYVLKNFLGDLEQPPRWVDGSGLSRYNLFSPASLVDILNRLYLKLPREQLLSFFPAGGVSGTIEEWYPGDPDPYIYAKTGTLGNNHNLSGYLLTKSGKLLIFSFMNNHFRVATDSVKTEMQSFLEWIRDHY